MLTAMNNRSLLLLVAGWLCAASAALAHDYTLGALKIGHPWARATVAGQRAGGAYLSIHNSGASADRLVSARMSGAASVEVHEMRMDANHVMRMREIGTLDVPAGATVNLEPGGYHFMLMGLKAPLNAGDKLPLVLRFEKAGEVEVVLHVEDKPAAPAAGAHKH